MQPTCWEAVTSRPQCVSEGTLGGGVHQALPVCLCRTVFSIPSYAPVLGLEPQLAAEELGGQANSNRDTSLR